MPDETWRIDVDKFLSEELIPGKEVARELGITEGAARKEMQRAGQHEWRGYSRTAVTILKRLRENRRRKITPPKEK